jgi:hyaluronan synthase
MPPNDLMSQTRQNPQRITSSHRIFIPKWGWALRIFFLSVIVSVVAFVIQQAWNIGDPFILYSTIVPIHSVLVLFFGWFIYKNPSRGEAGNELVSVIIPVYNQESMIELVIDSIFSSSYKNLEVIAVNDGSTDGTKAVLDKIIKKHKKLKVIHKKNGGKRKAIGTGFSASTGKFLTFIDSDSLIGSKSIEEFMKAFNSDEKIGGVVANAKAWNNRKNLLTRLQDVWYDGQFNIHKTCESVFGLVICCSGCMCAYRRSALDGFIQNWVEANVIIGDDRELTSFVNAKPWSKFDLMSAFAQKRLQHSSKYDDAEDRILTGQTLIEWKTVYVSSAVVYTDVPENFKGFLKQQIRWKKGYIRSQFFVSSFFWAKPPIMAFIFYLEFMASLTLPLILAVILVYQPLVLGEYVFALYFLAAQILVGFVEGVDTKIRNPTNVNWKYKPLMPLLSNFVISWALFPAIFTLRKNEWGTR